MKPRSRNLLIFFAVFIFLGILSVFLTSQSRFKNFCDELFVEELSSNSLTLHYTISDPEAYGISCEKLSLGSYDTDSSSQKKWTWSKIFKLKTICKNLLNEESQKTYDLLNYALQTELNGLDFYLLEEPLVPSIGVQSQLPILFAEYSFQGEADVVNYLSLLSCIPEYFHSILALEEKKIDAGLFMDNATVTELISYCKEFLSDRSTHFLIETFQERLDSLEMDSSKKDIYIEENRSALNSFVFPAYENLCTFLEKHLNQGQNADGLFYLPDGTDYYQWLLRSEIGCDMSLEEIENLLENALKKDARIIASLNKKSADLLSEHDSMILDTSNPAGLTSYLAKRAQHDFPEIPKVHLELRSVPSSMEPHLSPAFYLVPPLDHWDENIIYLNNASLKNDLSFFTTLAHESYPGHLYQTVYENNTQTHPIRRLLYFGGYTEGWATYAEQISYTYAPVSAELATLLSTSRTMTLNLYSHLDLYIHGYGWTEEDCAAYLKKFGITNTESVHKMFLLVKQQPANYLKYYLGYLEIVTLKERAIDCLGSHFDLKNFHRFILDSGPAPFTILETHFENWLQEQNRGFSTMENPLTISSYIIIERIQNHTTGTSKHGSIFNVLQFLIPRMERPELAIKNPPTTEISVIMSAVIKFPSSSARQ